MYLDFSSDDLGRPKKYISKALSGYKTQLLLSKGRIAFTLGVIMLIALNTSKKLTSAQSSLQRSTGYIRGCLNEAPCTCSPFVNIQ